MIKGSCPSVLVHVLVRARVHGSRETSKLLFMTLRQAYFTVQAVVSKATSPLFFKWAAALPKETDLDEA